MSVKIIEGQAKPEDNKESGYNFRLEEVIVKANGSFTPPPQPKPDK